MIATDKPRNNSPQPPILALARDLMFAGKIRATAQSLGVALELLREPAQLATLGGQKLIVDLNQRGALEAAVKWKSRTGGAIIGFVAHTDVETIARARSAGVDQVLARSAFVERLEQLLQDPS